MPTILKAGNSSSGYSMTPGGDGELEIKTGSGAGTTALTIDGSQNTALAGTLQVAGVATNIYPLVQGTAQTAPFASPNTSAEFTTIPSWAKRITVMLSGVSLSGTAFYILQVGSGSFATTGYNSGATSVSTATASTTNGSGATNITDSISLGGFTNTAASLAYGQVILTNVTGNTWVASGSLYIDGADRVTNAAGNVVLSGTLDRVRISTSNGTDTFDAGTINIMWE